MSASVGKYSLSRRLNLGARSEVWEATHEERKCALKLLTITEIPEKNAQDLRLFNNEVQVLSKLNHPNILTLYESYDSEVLKKDGEEIPVLCIVSELATRNDLFGCAKRTGDFAETLARHYFKVSTSKSQNGGQCLGISAHRAMHTEISNWKISSCILSIAVGVAGFGRSTLESTSEVYKGLTCVYHAPEMYAKIAHSGIKADLFALGVLPPFTRAGPQDMWYRMLCSCSEKFWLHMESRRKGEKFSYEFKSLISKLLASKPESRPTIEKIKSHPWYNGREMSCEEVKKEMEVRFVY
eukprot:TRINITY_DN2130_c0_g1_i7.p1 TRINITY_DN2130_c0_g1~~TRINITY_DN2130_c0_g1_i7.p1  ORF type:complete len:297 (-),score=15.83 TRINITY_DN2130_c0_g1_i7:275-1165(-)